MHSKVKNLKVDSQFEKAEITVKKLIKNISANMNINIDDQLNIWDLCEQMSTENFISLKQNVYFADFLRLFSINSDSNSDLPINIAEAEAEAEHCNLEIAQVKYTGDSSEQKKNEDAVTPTIHRSDLLSMSTRLDDLSLPDRFSKLITRLKNVSLSNKDFSIGETLGDLMSLPTSQVSCLPGIGLSYIKVFEELKLLIQVSSENSGNTSYNANIDITSADICNMRLSLAGVDKTFIKALEKYARHIDVVDLNDHLEDVLEFNKRTLIKLPGFGEKVIDQLIEFKILVENEIREILLGNIDYEQLESTLIVPKNLDQLSFFRMKQVLLEDIDNYLDKIASEDLDIIQKRWGFVEPKQTLEEIGEKHEVTRERIRQKEVKITNYFIRNLRISQSELWRIIEPNLNLDISNKLEDIFSCFYSTEDFYSFLDLVCGQENLIEYVYPKIDSSILNTYFAENGAPIHVEDIKEYLVDLNLAKIRNIDNVIAYLAHRDILSVENEYVWPRQLGKAEGSACVLVNHERGLPWLDIAKLVNSNGYSRTSLYEDRLDHEGFNSPDYIFLAGKGIYKHTKFIDTENILLDEIFIEFMEYAELNSRDVFHLNECYQFSISLQVYDYYEIRHFVKHFGEDYGLYFNGRSQTDSIGLEQGFKRLTQKDVIKEAMVRNEKPLTKPEIANVLKSKSLRHAAFYLEELIDSGNVVQVDRMLYTTPELAYKNINLNEYIDAIDKLLHKYDKPVEPSVFREELNQFFSKSYSKYFYSSIARLYAKREGWFRKHNLYSASEIPFRNLTAAFEIFCNIEFTVDKNFDAITEHVAINRKTVVIALSNWKVSRLKSTENSY